MNKIEKLKSFEDCVVDITVTYDMGLQVDILSKKGFASSMGNLGQWPCYKFALTNEIKELKSKLEKNQNLPNDEILQYEFAKTFCTYHSLWSGDFDLDEDKVQEVLEKLRVEIPSIDCSKELLYVYAEIESFSKPNIHFFYSYKELESYFLELWGEFCLYKFDDMSESDIDIYFDRMEEGDFGLPLNSFCSEVSDNED